MPAARRGCASSTTQTTRWRRDAPLDNFLDSFLEHHAWARVFPTTQQQFRQVRRRTAGGRDVPDGPVTRTTNRLRWERPMNRTALLTITFLSSLATPFVVQAMTQANAQPAQVSVTAPAPIVKAVA